jgi:hypothetical protein
VLLDRTPSWQPWLRAVVLVAGLAAAVLLLAGPRLSSVAATPHRRAPAPVTARTRLVLAALPVPLALVAALAGPAAYSLATSATSHAGALPSAGPAVASFGGPGASGGPGGAGGVPGSSGRAGTGSAGQARVPGSARTGTGSTGTRPAGRPGTGGFPGAAGGQTGRGGPGGGFGGLGGSTQVSGALTALLKNGASGYRWAAATVSSDSAAPLQLASGEPVMAIGGFNGTDPAPTLAQFERYVADHEIHYFIGTNADSFGGGSGDAAQITAWVKAHFTAKTVGGETVYDLTSPASS